MSEHDEVGTRLAEALHAEAERTTPEPGLQRILARTRRAPAWRRWLPLAIGVAAASVVAAALVVFGLPAGSEGPLRQPPVAGGGSEREVMVYMLGSEPGYGWDDGRLFPVEVTSPATENPGMDAVNALMSTVPRDPDYLNTWSSLRSASESSLHLIAPVSVTSVFAADGAIHVDFNGPVDNPWQELVSWAQDPALFAQQLVWTVQDAMDSRAPVLATIDGERAKRLLTAEVNTPLSRDPSVLAPVQIESPTQGESVSSPVTVSGQSATFEGNVVWRVKQDGEVVDHGFVQSEGANGVFGPFEFAVDLPPGDYTVEAYEESPENGDIINLDSKSFTVE